MTAMASAASGRPARPSRARRNATLVATAILVVWAFVAIDLEWDELLGMPGALAALFGRMFLEQGLDLAYVPTAAAGMLESIWIAWIGTIIGAVVSLPIGFFGAKNVSSGPVSNGVRQVLNAIRAFPELILAIVVFIPMAGLGAVAGALAIGFHSIGTLGKLTAEVVEGIDPGPVEAARAAGGGSLQIQRWGVLPQVLPEIVAFWLYRFEINIRAAAILGVVGAGGIGAILQETIIYRRYDKSAVAIIIVIVATILVDLVSGWVRRRIIEGAEARTQMTPDAVAVAAAIGGDAGGGGGDR